MAARKSHGVLSESKIEEEGLAIQRILDRFEAFNFLVNVSPVKDSKEKYLVVFQNNEVAQDAYHQADDIGYDMKKKWPDRPSPNRPIHYIANWDLCIREGKAFSGKKVG